RTETRSESREYDEEESLPSSPMTMQDGIQAVQQAIVNAQTPPRWPMYVRQAKQFLRQTIEGFDERKYGFASVVDLLRAAGKEGVLRIERDRQGAIRVFPGGNLVAIPAAEAVVDENEEMEPIVDATAEVEPEQSVNAEPVFEAEPVVEPPIVDVDIAADGEDELAEDTLE